MELLMPSGVQGVATVCSSSHDESLASRASQIFLYLYKYQFYKCISAFSFDGDC